MIFIKQTFLFAIILVIIFIINIIIPHIYNIPDLFVWILIFLSIIGNVAFIIYFYLSKKFNLFSLPTAHFISPYILFFKLFPMRNILEYFLPKEIWKDIMSNALLKTFIIAGIYGLISIIIFTISIIITLKTNQPHLGQEPLLRNAILPAPNVVNSRNVTCNPDK